MAALKFLSKFMTASRPRACPFREQKAAKLECWSARYAGDGRFYLLVRVLQVDELSGEVLLVGREVEVTVAAEVEEDGLPFSGLLRFERQVDGGFDRMRHLRRG